MHGLLGNTFANFIGQLYQTAVVINTVYACARGVINGFQRSPYQNQKGHYLHRLFRLTLDSAKTREGTKGSLCAEVAQTHRKSTEFSVSTPRSPVL